MSCRILVKARTNAVTTAYIDNFTTEYVDSITMESINVVSNNPLVTVDNAQGALACDVSAGELTVGDIIAAVSSSDYSVKVQNADYSEADVSDLVKNDMILVVTALGMEIVYDISTNDYYVTIENGADFAVYEGKNTLFYGAGKTVGDLKTAAGEDADLITVYSGADAAGDTALLADCSRVEIASKFGTFEPLTYNLALLESPRSYFGVDDMSNGGMPIDNNFKLKCFPSATTRNVTYSSGYGIGGREIGDASLSVISTSDGIVNKNQPYFDRFDMGVSNETLVFEYSYFTTGQSRIGYRAKDSAGAWISEIFDNAIGVCYNRVGRKANAPAEMNKWYRVTTVVDLKNKKATSYLNGKEIYVENISAATIVQHGISFYSDDQVTPIYIDDMEMFTTEAYTPATFSSQLESSEFEVTDNTLVFTRSGVTAGEILNSLTYGGNGEIVGIFADSAASVKRSASDTVENGDVIIIRDGQLFNYYTIMAPTIVLSDVYTVNADTIENIPYDTDVSVFTANIRYTADITSGAVMRGGDVVSSGALTDGDILRVSAAGAFKDYTLKVNPPVGAEKYEINNTDKTIKNVTYGTPAEAFIAKLVPGADTISFSLTRGGQPVTGAVQTGDILVVSSTETGDTNYTVTVKEYKRVDASFDDFNFKASKDDSSVKPAGFGNYVWGDRTAVETVDSCYIEGTAFEGREGNVLHIYSNPVTPAEGQTASVQCHVYNSINNVYDGATIEFEIMTPDYSTNKCVAVKGINSATGKEEFMGELFSLTPNGDMILCGGVINLGKYELNRWYHVAIEMDLNNKLVTVYINGAKAAENVIVTAPIFDNITHYRLQTSMAVGKISELYVDNFKIYNNWYGTYDASANDTEVTSNGIKIMGGLDPAVILPEGMTTMELTMGGYLDENTMGRAVFYDKNGAPIEESEEGYNSIKYITITADSGIKNTYTVKNSGISVVYTNPATDLNDTKIYFDSDINVYYANGSTTAGNAKAVVAVYERNTDRLVGVQIADISTAVPESAMYSEGTAKISMTGIKDFNNVSYSRVKVFVVKNLSNIEAMTDSIFSMNTGSAKR